MPVIYMDRASAESLTEKDIREIIDENLMDLKDVYKRQVYIRDSGKELMVYSMEADCWDEKAKIKATFSLICRIQKHSTGFRYGRKIQ